MNFTKAIYDFTQKTREGEIVWKRAPSSSDYSNLKIVEQYSTRYRDEALRLIVESRMDTEGDVDYHRNSIHLWLLDEQGEGLWPFPENDALGDLLNTVRFQTGKVGDRLKRLLTN